MSNLRQLTIALQDYGDQHDGTLPPGGGNFPYYKLGRTWTYASSLYYFILPYIDCNPVFLTGRWSINYTPGTDYLDGSNDGKGTPTYWGYLAGIQPGSLHPVLQAPGDPTQQPGGGWNGSDATSYIHNGLAFPRLRPANSPSCLANCGSQAHLF